MGGWQWYRRERIKATVFSEIYIPTSPVRKGQQKIWGKYRWRPLVEQALGLARPAWSQLCPFLFVWA